MNYLQFATDNARAQAAPHGLARKAKMKLIIKINMDNDAFADDANGAECARILRKLSSELAGSILDVGQVVRLRDVNGNGVGEATVEE